jgi:hypothetical protein
MQEGHSIAFLSKAFKGQALHLSTYEKELLSLVTAVQHWCPYLLGHTFTVRTDQQAFRYLLDQRVGTVFQQRWVSKLFGYDFIIEYKRGCDNKVVDAMSRLTDSASAQEHVFVHHFFSNPFMGLRIEGVIPLRSVYIQVTPLPSERGTGPRRVILSSNV